MTKPLLKVAFVGITLFSIMAYSVGLARELSQEMRLAVTTSFQNSGLADHLIPAMEEDLGIRIRLLVAGTGQALRLGAAGDVDAVLVHSREAEERFISEGHAPYRREIMFNDFVLVGPEEDPADISSASDILQALQRIMDHRALFISRGDQSGTHYREVALWQEAGVNSESLPVEWYREAGSGMGATLNIARGMGAYALSDRASWLKLGNQNGMTLLYEGDPRLFNQYSYLPVNKQKDAINESEVVYEVERWLTSRKGQEMIAQYRLNGEPLFIPNAR